MSDDMALTVLRAKVRALVSAHQNLDAAAQAINDRWPGERVCKGTLSRRLSGDLPPPPVHHVLALEDELGIYPVTNWMARRAHTVQEAPDVMQAVETAAKEIGEAVAQMPRAVLDLDDAQLGRVLAEIREAIEAMRALERALEAKASAATVSKSG
ncbi:hypothetical protein [Oceanicella actignis]|uniref:hypothetical protein n=1 Tax=Oceanicella actignis TaxID=1189325 RepID=UPI0011E79100|nr:hypothetical protein [Oceanicella actignis]TYO91449.1 hypothetical protein LY05_00302 [Oceanicella actignis]